MPRDPLQWQRELEALQHNILPEDRIANTAPYYRRLLKGETPWSPSVRIVACIVAIASIASAAYCVYMGLFTAREYRDELGTAGALLASVFVAALYALFAILAIYVAVGILRNVSRRNAKRKIDSRR